MSTCFYLILVALNPSTFRYPCWRCGGGWWLKATNARKSASKQYPAEKDMSHPDRLSRNYGPTRQASPITMATPTNEGRERERQSKSSSNCTSSCAVNADTRQSFVSVESVETCFFPQLRSLSALYQPVKLASNHLLNNSTILSNQSDCPPIGSETGPFSHM